MSQQNPPYSQSLVSEVRLMLKQELTGIQEDVHAIKIELTELRGSVVHRDDFYKALDSERDKRSSFEENERTKRERLETRINDQDREITKLTTTMKIYVAIAGSVAGVVGSLIGPLLMKAVAG